MEGTTRTRERVNYTTEMANDYRHMIYNGGTCTALPHLETNAHNTDIFECGRSEERTEDVVTDNFQKKIAAGAIINNPYYNRKTEWFKPLPIVVAGYSAEKYGCVPPRWYLQLTGTAYGQRGINEAVISPIGWFLNNDDLSSEKAQMADLAVTEAFSRIDTSQVQSLVSALESEKTVKGIYDTGRRVYKLFRYIKKLQLTKLRQELGRLDTKEAEWAWKRIKGEFSLDALANRYMEARYGWRPLYYEIQGAINAFKAQFAKRMTFRGFEPLTVHNEGQATYEHLLQPWFKGIYYFQQQADINVSVSAGVLCKVNLSSVDPWGLTRVIESVWELTPYSFIADWFFNIGDTISSWLPDAGLTPQASWVKVITETTCVTTLLAAVPYCSAPSYGYKWEGDYTAECAPAWFKETITTRTPSPGRAILPSLKIRLNAAKILDLVVVTRNLLYGGKFPLKQMKRV